MRAGLHDRGRRLDRPYGTSGRKGLSTGTSGTRCADSRQVAAASLSDKYGVRMRDQPAGGVTRDGQAGAFRCDGTGSRDRLGCDVAERHLRGCFVVRSVADAAGQLGSQHGHPLAQLGTEALPADLQVDTCRTAELGEANEQGDPLVPAFLVLPSGDEEEFGQLVHEQREGNRAFGLGNP